MTGIPMRRRRENTFTDLPIRAGALANAEKYFDLTDKEKDMILRHMWPLTPVPPKSREGIGHYIRG